MDIGFSQDDERMSGDKKGQRVVLGLTGGGEFGDGRENIDGGDGKKNYWRIRWIPYGRP